MAEQLISELAELMVDTIQVERHTGSDGMGARTYAAPANFQCRIKGGHVPVLDTDGRQQVSTVQVITAGAFGFESKDRFTLLPLGGVQTPASPPLINIKTIPDENGPHHEKLFF